jgi:hypothetical protein
MAVSAHHLFTGLFLDLEERFLETVSELKATDPLAPVDVLVGSNLLGLYLRRRAAQTFGGVANLRFVTFLDLARERTPEPDARPRLPALGETLLSRRTLIESPEGEVFGSLRERASTAALLVRTAADLRGAGIPVTRLAELLPAAARTPDRAVFLAKVAALLVRFETLRSAFADSDSLLERAAQSVRPLRDDPLLVYGLYDLGGVREALLRAVTEERPIIAFVPVDGAPEETGAGIPAVRAALFSDVLDVTPEAIPSTSAGPEEGFVVAPSETAEAREVVREILRAVDDGVPLHRIAILLREPTQQEPALVAELAQRRIPFFRPAGGGFSRMPVGRAALGLLKLASEGVESDALVVLTDVLEGLGLVPEGSRACVERSLVELRARGEWADLCQRLSRRLATALPTGTDESEGRLDRRAERVRRDLEALRSVVEILSPTLPETADTSWREWAERLSNSFATLFGSRPGADDLASAAAAGLAILEDVEPGSAIAAADMAPLLAEALEGIVVRHGSFERDGASILSLVSARGLLFDVVLVPGLIERSFLRPGRPDPLLFDEERATVARLSGMPLAPRTGRRHAREERFLFHLARTAARKRIVFLAAGREAATDRPRLLSPFLVELLEERRGGPVAEEDLSNPTLGTQLGLRWVRLGSARPSAPFIDAEEALRGALALAPRLAEALPAGFSAIERALQRGRSRAEDRFTEYEGRLQRPPVRLDLGTRPISPSRIERLASCAYHAFLVDALGLSAPEAPPEGLVLDKRTLGILAHAVLEELAREAMTTGGFLAPLVSARAAKEARTAVQSFLEEWELDIPPVLAEAASEQLATLLHAVAERERTRNAPLPLVGAEVRFGPGGLLARCNAGRVRVSMSGRIDRLDRDGPVARVVDYKFANPKPFGKKNVKGFRIVGGEKVQLAAYALAARALGATTVSSEYLIVSSPKKGTEPEVTAVEFDPVQTAEAVEALGKALGLLDASIQTGDLLPRTATLSSSSPCSFCDVAAVCGPGHLRIYERKRDHEKALYPSAPLFRLEEIP